MHGGSRKISNFTSIEVDPLFGSFFGAFVKFTIDTELIKLRILKKIGADTDYFPPSKSLLSLFIVRLTIAILAIIAAFMAITIIASENITLSLNEKGYKDAAVIFKAPLAVILLSIPLLALLASNHRSVQTMNQMNLTRQQIELTSGQNLFANYYKHLEEFSKWCDHIKGIGSVKSKRKLHRKLFPSSQAGNFELPAEIIMELNIYAEKFGQILSLASNESSLPRLAEIRVLTSDFSSVFWLETPEYNAGKSSIPVGSTLLYFPENGPRGFIKEHIEFIRAVDELFSFDSKYHSSKLVEKLSKLSLVFVTDGVTNSGVISIPELLRD